MEKSLNWDLHDFKFLVCQVILHVRIVDLPCLMTGFPPQKSISESSGRMDSCPNGIVDRT